MVITGPCLCYLASGFVSQLREETRRRGDEGTTHPTLTSLFLALSVAADLEIIYLITWIPFVTPSIIIIIIVIIIKNDNNNDSYNSNSNNNQFNLI